MTAEAFSSVVTSTAVIAAAVKLSGRLLVDGTFLSELPFVSTKPEVILIPFLYSPGSEADESLIGVVDEWLLSLQGIFVIDDSRDIVNCHFIAGCSCTSCNVVRQIVCGWDLFG